MATKGKARAICGSFSLASSFLLPILIWTHFRKPALLNLSTALAATAESFVESGMTELEIEAAENLEWASLWRDVMLKMRPEFYTDFEARAHASQIATTPRPCVHRAAVVARAHVL